MVTYADVLQLHARRLSPEESGLPRPASEAVPPPPDGTASDSAPPASKPGDEEKIETFEEVAARNKKNAERMARERAATNKSVLRSYRIKS